MDAFSTHIENLKAVIKKVKEQALLEAAESMREEIDKRIFERSRRTDGAPIGQGKPYKDGTAGTTYEKNYAKKRQKRGLQIGFIDLQMNQNLRKAVTVLRTSSNGVKIVVQGKSAETAANLDEQKGGIFKPTKQEIALAKKRFSEILRARIVKR